MTFIIWTPSNHNESAWFVAQVRRVWRDVPARNEEDGVQDEEVARQVLPVRRLQATSKPAAAVENPQRHLVLKWLRK